MFSNSKKPKPFDPYKPTPEELELLRERKAFEQGWNKEEQTLTLPNGTVIRRKEHRCNGRLKDIVEGVVALKIGKTWDLFWQCMKSNPGCVNVQTQLFSIDRRIVLFAREEPLDPFVYLRETPKRSKPENTS